MPDFRLTVVLERGDRKVTLATDPEIGYVVNAGTSSVEATRLTDAVRAFLALAHPLVEDQTKANHE